MSSNCSANCYTKGIQITGSVTYFPLLLFSCFSFMFHHPQGTCTGKKDLGGQGLNKGKEGVENKSKTEERAGGIKGVLA